MLATLPRRAPLFTEKALEVSAEAAEIFAAAALVGDQTRTLPRPQRYEDLARRYGTVVWVYAAVSRKAQDVASVPLRVLRREGDEVSEVRRDHALRRLLSLVNPFMTAMDLLETTSANLDLAGNAYWLKFTNREGLLRELWPVRPDLVRVIASPTDYIAGYAVTAGSEEFTFRADQVVHFREFNPFNDYYGLGPMVAAWGPALIEEDAQVWNRNIVRNAGRLDGVLQSDQPITPAQAEEAGERFRQLFAGPRNAGRTIALGKGFKYSAIATTPKELDFVASRKLTREEILAVFKVRPVILGLEMGDIGRRSEQIRDYFYSTIRNRAGRIVGTINEFIVPGFRDAQLEVIADLETALLPYEDRLALAQADSSDIAARILTPNEIRRRRGLPPVAGGDQILVPISMVPIEQAGALAGLGGPGLRSLQVADEARDLLRIEFEDKAGRLEQPFAAAVRRALAAGRDELASSLRLGLSPSGAITDGMATLRAFLAGIGQAQLPGILEAGWTRAVRLVNTGLASRGLVKQTARVVLDFDLAQPLLARYLAERPHVYADEIVASLAAQFRQLLGDLAGQGASVDQLAAAVVDQFDVIAAARAALIARTEVIAASNLAAMTAYRESDVVASQEWLSARDEKVRPAHAEADGQVRALGEPFDVGGAQLAYPGDPRGPIELIANCRCSTLPVLKEA